MHTPKSHTVEAQMLIRKPVELVFQAFLDPAITTKFWFSKASGKLEEGKTVTWVWEVYQVSTKVTTDQIIPNQFIATEWGHPATKVAYHFQAIGANKTYVTIKNYGFLETGDALMEVLKDRTAGFTTVLDGAKAYLEYGISLNLVFDKYPKELNKSGRS